LRWQLRKTLRLVGTGYFTLDVIDEYLVVGNVNPAAARWFSVLGND
jgi:hypothetical protein